MPAKNSLKVKGYPGKSRLLGEVKSVELRETAPAKLLENVGLAHLTRPLNKERLPSGPILPSPQLCSNCSFHAD